MSRDADAGADAPGAMTGRSPQDAGPPDAAAPAQEPPPGPTASGGSSGAAGMAGAASPAAGSGGASGAGGAPPAPDNKTALIDLLNERAGMNGPDALLVRSVLVQLDTPFPPSAASLRLLLSTAVASFGCPALSPQPCTTVCNYVSDACFTCVSDPQCREQLVGVCPNALTGCLTFGP